MSCGAISCFTGKQGGSSSSLARPCSGRLLGGSARQDLSFSLSNIAAEASALSAPAAAATAESAHPQSQTALSGNHPPSLLGFSLSEPADSAAYTSHAAPRDVTDLWASPQSLTSDAAAAAASDGTAVRLVPVADAMREATSQQRLCSGGEVAPSGMPALLADTRAGGDELTATAQALVRHALAAAGGAAQKQVRQQAFAVTACCCQWTLVSFAIAK